VITLSGSLMPLLKGQRVWGNGMRFIAGRFILIIAEGIAAIK
jgi:hypothetical protein